MKRSVAKRIVQSVCASITHKIVITKIKQLKYHQLTMATKDRTDVYYTPCS